MDLIKQIFDSGVVGCGGAGFPTHVKLKASPEILIINGAERLECEAAVLAIERNVNRC